LPRSGSDRDQIVYSTLRSQSIKNKTDREGQFTPLHAMPASAQLRWTEYQLSLPPHSAYCYIQTRHGKGEVGISSKFAQQLAIYKVLCWLPLTASRNTPFLPSSARQS